MKPICCFALLCLTTVPLAKSNAQTRHAPGKPSSDTLAQEIAAAKRAGFPVSAKDLQAPLPPPAQNAAPIYTQLDQLLKTRPLSQEDIAPDTISGSKLPDAAQMGQVRRALTNRSDILTLIHTAASRPKCVFVVDWTRGPALVAAVEFPREARLREAVRWLSAESALQLYDKKPLEAIRTQALGFQVARHAASSPMLISYLVGIASDAITLGGMRRILYTVGDDPQAVAAVRQAIEQSRTPLDLGHALRGEFAFSLTFMEQVRKAGPGGLGTLLSAEGDGAHSQAAQRASQNRQSFDRIMGTMKITLLRKEIQAAEGPYPQAKLTLSALDAEVERKKNTDPAYILAALYSPLWMQAMNKTALSEATAATVRSAAALLVWKANHGVFPATLAEAISPVPTDPYNGQMLSYRQEGSGFVVYSVGESGKFDGGKPDVKPPATEALFRYPLPFYMQTPALSSPGMMGGFGPMGQRQPQRGK